MTCEADGQFCSDGDGASSGEVDLVLRALSNPLCRHIVRQLVSQPGRETNVDEIVESYLGETDDVEGDDRTSIEIECHHAHLPALKSVGVIDFDEQSGAVRYRPDPFVESLLDLIDQREE